MDALGMLRATGALLLLLGILAGALWATRRFDLRLPGRMGHRSEPRLELVERLVIDQRRSAVLIRCDSREHLVIVAPEGHVMLSSPDMPAGPPEADAQARAITVDAPPCVVAPPVSKRTRPRRARWHLPPQDAARSTGQTIEKCEQRA